MKQNEVNQKMAQPLKGDKRIIFGWAMYDWANSAYLTTLVAVLLPIYFESVVIPKGGFEIGGTLYAAETIWALLNGVAAFFIFISAPMLGAIADFASAKKKFLLSFCYVGVVSSIFLFFCQANDVWLTMSLFFISQIGFIGSTVFYDAFLPQIASKEKQNWVSSKGFAYGYIGGGIQFTLSLGLIAGHSTFGISRELASRLAMLMSSVWWGGFALVTAFLLKETPHAKTLPAPLLRVPFKIGYVALGFSRVLDTTRKVGQLKHLLLFLLAFMIYNDGIQTVIKIASIYGKGELKLSDTAIMITFLIVQFIAFFGAYLFAWIAERIGTKYAVILSLVGWSIIVTFAYFIHNAVQYFILGAMVGLILGGSQSLSRSFYSSMIPQQASAEFFGFYSVFSKFSSIWGPFIFAIIRHNTGSSRNAIISLILFFVVGLILLPFVNEKKAREASEKMIF